VTSLAGEALRLRCIEAVVEEGERVGVLAQEMAAGLIPTGHNGHDGHNGCDDLDVRDGLDVTVPWIPDWTARDLIGHLGTVHRWATAILAAGHAERPGPQTREAPPDDALLDWYAAGLSALVTTLRTTRPDAPAWHMSPAAEQVAASWARRQAHELLVHRMDLEVAAGVPNAWVDPALAEDGVDELLTIIVPRWAHTEPLISAESSTAVTSTDTGRSWSVRVRRGAVTVTPVPTGHEDAHLEAPATQLLLRLWGRPAEVVLAGDPGAEALLRGR
jgi:uncharacterized protein (TIGR03083 family)